MTKEQLKENYFQLDCELGSDHPETERARKEYFDYCMAEQETLKGVLGILKKYNIDSTRFVDTVYKETGYKLK